MFRGFPAVGIPYSANFLFLRNYSLKCVQRSAGTRDSVSCIPLNHNSAETFSGLIFSLCLGDRPPRHPAAPCEPAGLREGGHPAGLRG